MTSDQIENTFQYRAPNSTQVEKYAEIRQIAREFACMIETLCPGSREKSVAFTNLQQTVMWANASIAINGSR